MVKYSGRRYVYFRCLVLCASAKYNCGVTPHRARRYKCPNYHQERRGRIAFAGARLTGRIVTTPAVEVLHTERPHGLPAPAIKRPLLPRRCDFADDLLSRGGWSSHRPALYHLPG